VSLWLAFNSLGSPDLKQLPAAEDPPPEWLIRNVERWLPLIHRWHPDFTDLDPAWILALIAQESQGDPFAVADDLWKSTGLMQVGPRPWLATSEQLLNPAMNIYVGMKMLNDIFNQTNGNLRFALAAYNCGFEGVAKNFCGSYGGYKYADRIIDYWLPVFRDTLWVRAGEDDLIGNWLKEFGYTEHFGDWEEEEELECQRVLPERRFRPRTCLD
jgi:hypothetical protein